MICLVAKNFRISLTWKKLIYVCMDIFQSMLSVFYVCRNEIRLTIYNFILKKLEIRRSATFCVNESDFRLFCARDIPSMKQQIFGEDRVRNTRLHLRLTWYTDTCEVI